MGCELFRIVVVENRSMCSTVCLTCLDNCCLSTASWKVLLKSHLSSMILSEAKRSAHSSHPCFHFSLLCFHETFVLVLIGVEGQG